MVQIISTKKNSYNEFFAEVIDALGEQYNKTPKLMVIGIPDQEDNDYHLSIYGMDSIDMFQTSALIQHEATRYLMMEERAQEEADILDDYEDELDESDEQEDI